MAALGMICEWNPFHLGHAWLLRELKRCYSLPVVCVMSGNFVQRGEPAVAEKRARAEMALRCGADVVFELPTVWAMATAERFARGGIALLRRTGVVTQVAFGSECGDAAALMRAAACLDGEDFRAALQRRLAGGDTFAVCRARAAAELLGETDAALLREPNNILGIEYCRALRGSGIGAVTLPRTGARHDGAASGGIASASEIRRLLHEGQPERAMAFLPPEAAEVLRREMAQGRAPVTLENCERAVLAKLRTLREEDFLPYDGGGEGLYRRVYRAVRAGTSVGEILALAKTKRYPMARLRRMLLAAWLEVPQPPEEVPYLRLLGAGKDGRPLLRQMQRSGVPVLTKPADVGRLGPAAQELFARECAWTDLYMLGMPSLRWSACGSDWKTTPILL